MPLYRLRRMSDLAQFEEEAADDEHAVRVFSVRLNTALTLEEDEAAVPEYMMGRVEKGVHWVGPEDIPVWEVS